MIKMLMLCLILGVVEIRAQESPVGLDNVPHRVSQCLNKSQNRYQASRRMNPFYLRADFDADGNPDYAILITESTSKKEGIAVCFGDKQKEPEIIGAGVSVGFEGGIQGDDIAIFNVWGIAISCDVKKDCLYLEQAESGSGYFIWSGQGFVWKQGAI